MVTFFVGEEGRGLAASLLAFTVAVLTVIAVGLFAVEGGGREGEGRGRGIRREGGECTYINYNSYNNLKESQNEAQFTSTTDSGDGMLHAGQGNPSQAGATLDREPPQHTLSPPYLSLAGL